MTLESIADRMHEIDAHVRNAGIFGLSVPGSEIREYKALERQRAEILNDRRLADERAAVQARRDEILAIVAPVQEVWRPFVRSLLDDFVDKVLAHDVRVEWDGLCPRGSVRTRTIHVDYVLSERAYSTALHELAHVVNPRANGIQQRHEYGERSRISPCAEAHAWRWAIDHCYRQCWTTDMQRDLVEAITTYEPKANGPETEEIRAVIAYGAARVTPAPDSVEGRARRVRQIQREDKVRQIEHERHARAQRLRAFDARARMR